MEQKFLPEISISVDHLPSKGKPYPEDAKISYKTYSFGEVKNASVSNLDIGKSIRIALSGIITNFDKDLLTVMDTLYIGILRKVSSFNGVEFSVPFKCESCSVVSSGNFNHSDIAISDLPDEITELPISFQLDDEHELQFSPMNVKTLLEIEDGKYKKYCKGEKIDKLTALALCCVNLKFEEAHHLIGNVYDPDIAEDLEYIDELMVHGVEPLEITCKNDLDGKQCNHVNSVKLEGLEHLLKPFRTGKTANRRRVRFGNTSSSKPV